MPEASGFTRVSRSPAQVFGIPGSWVGASSASRTNRLTARLDLFDSETVLTSSATPVSPAATRLPTSAISSTAWPVAAVERPSTHRYGRLTTTQPAHSVSVLTSLPSAMSRRRTGVSSSVSSVCRSRSPLTASAPATIVASTPTASATCSARFTASRRSRKLSPRFVAARYVIALSSTPYANISTGPRPPTHRSRLSCRATTTHPLTAWPPR